MQRLHKKDTKILPVAVSECLVSQATGKILQRAKNKAEVGKSPTPHLYYSQQTEILLLTELFHSQ